MKLSAPRKIVWLIALILAILVLVARFIPILTSLIPPVIVKYDFWVMTVAYALLLFGTLFENL